MTNKAQFLSRVSEIMWSVDHGHISRNDGRLLIGDAYTEYREQIKYKRKQ